jgi:hypothetical protein
MGCVGQTGCQVRLWSRTKRVPWGVFWAQWMSGEEVK